WIISQHIPIVNHSNSFLTPPYNDTGFPSKAIDRAARNGVLWVNSAGNFGLRHWAGMFVDRNGNARNDFGGDDAMPLPAAQGQPLFFVLSWSSGSVKAGYAMLVQRQTGSGWTTVYDAEPDHGEAAVSYRATDPGPYRLVLAKRFGPAVTLNLFSRTLSMPMGFRTLRG